MCSQVTEPAGGARGPEAKARARPRCGAYTPGASVNGGHTTGQESRARAVETPQKHAASRSLERPLRTRYASGRSCLTPEEKVVLGKGSKERRVK